MMIFAMFATVILLVWMGFFMLGSLPLLVLKHDTPLDSRFIRGLFNVYYTAIMVTASVGAAAFALAGRIPFALVFVGIGLIGAGSRHWVLGKMDALRATMTATDHVAIRKFRQLHIGGMVANLVQLLSLCVAMAQVTRLS
jgi:hypothetical protein